MQPGVHALQQFLRRPAALPVLRGRHVQRGGGQHGPVQHLLRRLVPAGRGHHGMRPVPGGHLHQRVGLHRVPAVRDRPVPAGVQRVVLRCLRGGPLRQRVGGHPLRRLRRGALQSQRGSQRLHRLRPGAVPERHGRLGVPHVRRGHLLHRFGRSRQRYLRPLPSRILRYRHRAHHLLWVRGRNIQDGGRHDSRKPLSCVRHGDVLDLLERPQRSRLHCLPVRHLRNWHWSAHVCSVPFLCSWHVCPSCWRVHVPGLPRWPVWHGNREHRVHSMLTGVLHVRNRINLFCLLPCLLCWHVRDRHRNRRQRLLHALRSGSLLDWHGPDQRPPVPGVRCWHLSDGSGRCSVLRLPGLHCREILDWHGHPGQRVVPELPSRFLQHRPGRHCLVYVRCVHCGHLLDDPGSADLDIVSVMLFRNLRDRDWLHLGVRMHSMFGWALFHIFGAPVLCRMPRLLGRNIWHRHGIRYQRQVPGLCGRHVRDGCWRHHLRLVHPVRCRHLLDVPGDSVFSWLSALRRWNVRDRCGCADVRNVPPVCGGLLHDSTGRGLLPELLGWHVWHRIGHARLDCLHRMSRRNLCSTRRRHLVLPLSCGRHDSPQHVHEPVRPLLCWELSGDLHAHPIAVPVCQWLLLCGARGLQRGALEQQQYRDLLDHGPVDLVPLWCCHLSSRRDGHVYPQRLHAVLSCLHVCRAGFHSHVLDSG